MLKELLLAVKHFLEELFTAGTSTQLLSAPHLLLESVQCLRLLLVDCENALSLVELAIDELILKQVITVALTHQLGIGLLISAHIELYRLAHTLLDWVQVDKVLLQFGLIFDPIRYIVTVLNRLQLT